MSTFFGSVWWLLVALGVLVTFHEFGHFWVARRCVKVLRFSMSFGKPLNGAHIVAKTAAPNTCSPQSLWAAILKLDERG